MNDSAPVMREAEVIDLVANPPEEMTATSAANTQRPAKVWLLWVSMLLAVMAVIAAIVMGWYVQTQAHQLQAQWAQWQAHYQQQWQAQSDEVAAQQQRLAELAQQQQQQQAELAQQQAKLSPVSWQLTQADAVNALFLQLQQWSLIAHSNDVLRRFLQQWQYALSQQQVADHHPLRMAIAQELAALAADHQLAEASIDWSAWQQWLASTPELEASVEKTSDTSDEGRPWWHFLQRFVHWRAIDREQSAQLTAWQDQTLWRVQSQLALLNIRWGMMRNQPELVHESAQQLQNLLQQAHWVVSDERAATLTQWQQWLGWQPPQWSVLRAYVQSLGQVTP